MNGSSVHRLSSVLVICVIVIILDGSASAAQTAERPVEIGGQLSILRISAFEILAAASALG
jgi:hypothetical protein